MVHQLELITCGGGYCTLDDLLDLGSGGTLKTVSKFDWRDMPRYGWVPCSYCGFAISVTANWRRRDEEVLHGRCLLGELSWGHLVCAEVNVACSSAAIVRERTDII